MKNRMIRSIVLAFLLILIPLGMDNVLSWENDEPLNKGEEGSNPIINRTRLEQSLDEAIELKDNKKITGNVSFNGTTNDFDIYRVKFEKGWLFFNFHREISLSRESEGNGTIYLDVYGVDLEKVVSHETLITENQSNNWTNFDQEDIDGNEMFFVIYGNGNYSLTTEQHLKYEQVLILHFLDFIIISILIITFTIIAGIMYIYMQKRNKMKQDSKIKRILNEKDRNDIERKIKKFKMISIIKYIIAFLVWTFISIFYIKYPHNITYFSDLYFNINNNNDLVLNLLLSGIFFLIILFSIFYLYFYIYYQAEKERMMKTSTPDSLFKNYNCHGVNLREKTFLLENILHLIVIFILSLSVSIFCIESFIKFFEYYCCNFIFIFFILPFLILYPIAVLLSFQTVEYKNGSLKFYIGPKITSGLNIRGKKLEKEDIKSIRPIPASLYYDLLPGLQRRDGKFILVKTGILIEDYNGKFYRVLTSRPMEIVSLMRKGED